MNCSNCDAIYISQSGRSIETCLKEHVRCLKTHNSTTGLSEQCVTYNHQIDTDNVKTLHLEKKVRSTEK